MPKILLERSHSGWLTPYDAASAEYLKGWKPGRVLEASVRYVRSPQHHRRTMALVNLLWQSGLIEANSFDAALDIAKLIANFTETRIVPDTRDFTTTETMPHVVPKSISYANADEQAYSEGFARPLERWALAQLPHLTDEALKREIEGFA